MNSTSRAHVQRDNALVVTLSTLQIRRKDAGENTALSGASVGALGSSARGARLTKGAHTSLALSVRRKESYTWNHS